MQSSNLSQILILLLLLLITFSSTKSKSMAAADSSPSVYIVYTEQPDALIQAEDHHIKTLTSVFQSEDAAKDALGYVYKNAATGFSAKLTPAQVEILREQPGVLQIVPSQTLHLHSGRGTATMNL